MTPKIHETPTSREGSKGYTGGPLTREFTVLYEPSLAEAILLVENTAAVKFEGRERKNIAWRSLGAPDLWSFVVTYGSAGGGNDGLSPDQFSFRITGATAHINQSFETLGRFGIGANQATGTNLATDGVLPNGVTPDGVSGPDLGNYVGQTLVITGGAGWAPGLYTIVSTVGSQWLLNAAPANLGAAGGVWYLPPTAPDMKGAIGQDRDSLQGCDIVIPSGEFALMASRTSFTHADYRNLKSLVGKVSDRDWKGYPAGTLQYLGAEPAGSDGTLLNGQPTQWWCLGHQFRHEEHRTNVRLGGITLPYVPAFSYVWCRYAANPVDFELTVRPKHAYIERAHGGYFNPELLDIP